MFTLEPHVDILTSMRVVFFLKKRERKKKEKIENPRIDPATRNLQDIKSVENTM